MGSLWDYGDYARPARQTSIEPAGQAAAGATNLETNLSMERRCAITVIPVVAACLLPVAARADDRKIDLSPKAKDQWAFVSDAAAVRDGELVLDGWGQASKAFFAPLEWSDVSLSAGFLVEPADKGVLACGFVIRARDVSTCYYVHYDRTQAILCRSDAANPWIEIKRVSGLDRPAGQWHRGKLECVGRAIKVYLNDKLLFEAEDPSLESGRIGFYAGEGRVHVKDIVVSGKPHQATRPFIIPPPNFTYVCKDAGAGGYEAFPDVCRLIDGRLMAVFYAGYDHVSLPNEQCPKGGRISYGTSSDEGRTWSEAQVLYDGPDDDRDPSIVQLKNGRMICNFFQLRKADSGYRFHGSWMVVSEDAGRSWSPPRLIAEQYACSSPIRELADGRLILGLYRETEKSAIGAVTISEDGGNTWGQIIDIDNGGHRFDAETDLIRLKDGGLYAVQRSPNESMGYSISKDGGKTWSISKLVGFPGHCPYLLRTADNMIILAHRLPNTSLHYSLDECRTWSENVLVDGVIGAYPSMVNLKDGTVLIVYYEEGPGSSIRARRFRAGKSGIEWLPCEPARSATSRAD